MNRKIALASFVKTPGLSPLKTRLAKSIGSVQAEQFYQLSLACIEETLLAVQQARNHTEVFWAVAESNGISHSLWSKFKITNQGEGDLGDRLAAVFEQLFSSYDSVIFIGSDSPQLSPTQINGAIDLLEAGKDDFVIGPAADGGYYLLGANQNIPRATFKQVPYSSDKTCAIMLEELATLGTTAILPTQFDVDTVEDLIQLEQDLANLESPSNSQINLRKWILELKLSEQ